MNFRDRGPELTRGARGLKLWLSVRTFGLDAFRAAIAHGIALAEHAEAQLRARDGWEVVTPAQLGIVTFRRDGLDDAAHTRLSAATVEDGYAAPSTTRRRRPRRPAPVHDQPAHDASRRSTRRSSGWRQLGRGTLLGG